MKKMVISMAVMLTVALGAMAQEGQQTQQRQRRQFNPQEMIQRRTDATVKRYQLNEEQAQKLLELNKKYAQQMGGRFGGGGRQHFAGRPEGGDGKQQGERGERRRGNRPQMSDSALQALQHRAPAQQSPEEMRKAMEAYDTELQQIMTPEQYKAYKEEQQKRQQQRQQQRPQRRPQQN